MSSLPDRSPHTAALGPVGAGLVTTLLAFLAFSKGEDAWFAGGLLLGTGTYFITSQGRRDTPGGKIRMLGTDDDPVMKAMGHTKEFVHVLDLRSPDEFAVEVWVVDTRTSARKEFKYMECLFKRRK